MDTAAVRPALNPVEVLLPRLERVRARGPGRWTARCPAHEDRSPSLSIRELDDGRALIHDFAGCAPADVLAAVGLGLRDLFPSRLADHVLPKRERHHIHAARVALKALRTEAGIVALAADFTATGVELDEEDRRRLWLAAERCWRAAELCT